MSNSYDSYNKLSVSLERMDERGLVLSLAAFAEDTFGELLRTLMLNNRAASALLDGFSAPLGSYSSRLKACFAFGLILKQQYDDFEQLRKIRNAFSHTWQDMSLDQPPCRDWVDAVHYNSGSDTFPVSRLAKLRSCISFRLVELRVACLKSTQQGPPDKRGDLLVTGFTGTPEQQLQLATDQFEDLVGRLRDASGPERDWAAFRLKNLVPRLTASAHMLAPEARGPLLALRDRVRAAVSLLSAVDDIDQPPPMRIGRVGP